MVQETMTVHKALCELKVLRKRIEKAIGDTKPIAVKDSASKKADGMDMSAFAKLAKGAHDSAITLIRRQNAIKAAINEHNSCVKINVCGKEYSIAQAIWLMQYGLEDKKRLLSRYAQMLAKADKQIETKNGDELTRRAESFAISMFGSKDKADPKEFNAVMDSYIANHTAEMYDPIDIRKVIADLEKEISDFESNVDSAIQVANATRTITIEY